MIFTAWMEDYPAITFTQMFEINVICTDQPLKFDQIIPDITYDVGQGQLTTIQMSATTNSNCDTQISYEICYYKETGAV